MADISKIILPDGNQYDIKDAIARDIAYQPEIIQCVDITEYQTRDPSSTVKTLKIVSGEGVSNDIFHNLPLGKCLIVSVRFWDNNVDNNVKFQINGATQVETYRIFYNSTTYTGNNPYICGKSLHQIYYLFNRSEVIDGSVNEAGYFRWLGCASIDAFSDTTYTLSMTNNVITLTSSTGSTSTATLPVYNGGVV